MKVFNNVTDIVKDDMVDTMKKNSKISIAAACFSMYAYNELKKQLEGIDEFRFIFTSPTFVIEKAGKQKREFYIPRIGREQSLYGTEFEIKLRNEMTQKAIARECAEWIKRKAVFRSNTTGENMPGFMTVDNYIEKVAYMPLSGFTTVDIGCDRGNNAYNMVNRMESPFTEQYMQIFESIWNDKDKLQDVTDVVIDNITSAYNENSPEFIYFMTLFHVFSEFLDDISEDDLPNEATGFKQSKIWNLLYDFQKDAVLAIINKLEKYNGCILADSVGLGKTFTALAVVKYYENRNKTVLVLCPKKLAENWNTYKDNYVNNPIALDRLNYDVLFHTDLSRNGGMSNGLDLDRLNWGNYDLVVIDESHNFRNGAGTHANTSENRYVKLMDKIIRAGVKTKVLMLSATPVNNRFVDLRNQLAIAYEGDAENLDSKLNTTKSLEDIFRQAQKAFNAWSKLDPEDRTTDALLRTLDFDFFEVLDSVTIARSRKHIEKYYSTAEIGKFPERLKPISLRPNLTSLKSAITYNQIYEQLMLLTLCIYTPSNYIFPSKLDKYMDLTHNKGANLTQKGREEGIRRLMSINLLKRLESSVWSFNLTLSRIRDLITSTINAIDRFEKYGNADVDMYEAVEDEFDMDDGNTEYFTVGKKVKIDLADMDYTSWRNELKADEEVLELLTLMVADITPAYDTKLQTLFDLISKKIENPINEGNKKMIIFSAFSDTAEYLYENVSTFVKKKYGLDTAIITGAVDGKSTIKGLKATLNNVLTCFSAKLEGLGFNLTIEMETGVGKTYTYIKTRETIETCLWKTDEFGNPDYDDLKIDSEVATDNDKEEFLAILKTGKVTDGQKSNYALNYKLFLKNIEQFLSTYPGYFPYLPTRILNNCILLPIEAESQNTALRIFSTLNDRGLPLSDADIFKAQFYNHFKAKGQKDAFIERWKALEAKCNELFHPSQGTPMDELFTRYMYYLRAKKGNRKTTVDALRRFYETNKYAVLKQDETFDDLEDLADFWERVQNQDEDSFDERIRRRFLILLYAPNSMWTFMVSVYFLTYRDENGSLDQEDFYNFLNIITAFIMAYSIVRPGVNALRTPVFPELIKIVNKQSVDFKGNLFDYDTTLNALKNYVFTNQRPATKSMLVWWAFNDESQPLMSPEIKFDIEHIYAKKRQEIEKSLKSKSSLESLGNKSILEKTVNIRASDYRLSDKKKYYEGYSTPKGEVRKGTNINELLDIATAFQDFTEVDIDSRKSKILFGFMKYLSDNGLIAE